MIIEGFDKKSLEKCGKLFSEEFENRARYAFHGTSTAYSYSIEKNGFQYPFISINPDELIKLADSLQSDHADLAASLKSSSSRSTRISFAPYSYIAVDHAIKKRGGQVAGLCRMAIAAGGLPSESLIEQLALFDSSTTCVYAVDLSDLSKPQTQFEFGVFQSSVEIASARIVAKVVIPLCFKFTEFERSKKAMPPSGARYIDKSLAKTLDQLD